MRLPLEKDRLATEIGQILGLHDWRRQPRERGELVDHASEVIHLADDRVGALLKGLGIVRYLRQIAPPQPFGGELDRRQRVLDLMGDAPDRKSTRLNSSH